MPLFISHTVNETPMGRTNCASRQPGFSFCRSAPWPRSQQVLSHALVCEELIKQWDIRLDEAATLLHNVGVYLHARGQYQEAVPLHQYALSIEEKRYGHDHPHTTYLIHNLANLYKDQGKYDQAEPLFQRALASREKMLGPDHPDTVGMLNNLAILYRNQGKYDQAELFQRALAICEKML